jgi:hypothetical protein
MRFARACFAALSFASLMAPQALVEQALAEYRLRPLLPGMQTWNFGRGNSNAFAVYKWDFVTGNLALKLKCLYPWSPVDHPSCANPEGFLEAPDGYRICAATLLLKPSRFPVPSIFTGTLADQNRQLAWYADFGNGPQPLSARVRFVLVPTDAVGPQCMHDGPVYLCGAGAGNQRGCDEMQSGGVQR